MKTKLETLKEIIDLHQLEIFRLCFFLTHNKAMAEDLTQETFLKGLEKAEQLRDHETALPWLKSIARSLFLDYKKSARVSKNHTSLQDLDESSLLSLPKTENQIAAFEALAKVSDEERFILVLIDIQESSYEEAALILGCPIGTVKSKLSRARQAFSEVYSQKSGTNPIVRSSIK